MTLALERGLPVLAGDHEWSALNIGIKVKIFRSRPMANGSKDDQVNGKHMDKGKLPTSQEWRDPGAQSGQRSPLIVAVWKEQPRHRRYAMKGKTFTVGIGSGRRIVLPASS